METCLCGCGETVSPGRKFVPGHDQKLRADLENAVGGLGAMKDLVEAHLANNDEFKRGQMAGLQHVCALIVNHLAADETVRAAFCDLLNSHDSADWEKENSLFLQGLTHSFSEVSLNVFREGA